MELDDLKKIWQNNRGQFQPKGDSELISMMKGNSTSLVEKLKRSVWFELIFTCIAGVGLLIYALMLPSGALKFITVSILFLFVAYSVYYVKKILLLNRFSPGEDNLKASLEKLIESLKNYLSFYRQSYTILYPVYFALGLLFAAIERGSERFIERISEPKIILSLVVMGGVLYFLSTWFASWYLGKLYGNHLHKLTMVLKDLSTSDREDDQRDSG